MSDQDDEAKRAAAAEHLAQVNVLRVSQVIGRAGQQLLEEADKKTIPTNLMITNAMFLANAVHANEKNRASAFRRKPGVAQRITKVEMVRMPLPAQIAAGAAPVPVESEGGQPANAGANAAHGVSGSPGPVGPSVESTPRAAPDAPDRHDPDFVHEPEVITDEPAPAPAVSPETASLALEIVAEQSDDYTAALMRALARSRGR